MIRELKRSATSLYSLGNSHLDVFICRIIKNVFKIVVVIKKN
jgi:hypothetical protein